MSCRCSGFGSPGIASCAPSGIQKGLFYASTGELVSPGWGGGCVSPCMVRAWRMVGGENGPAFRAALRGVSFARGWRCANGCRGVIGGVKEIRRVAVLVRALCVVGACLGGVCACAGCEIGLRRGDTLTILSFNVENLFDSTLDGSEYAEFTPQAGWDEGDVIARLSRLGDFLSRVEPPPDLLVLTEVENEALFERLCGEYLPDLALEYTVFCRDGRGATGVGIASRYPISAARSLMARSGGFPPLRPTVEARVVLPMTEIVVFANHWKSKRGGEAQTEELRRAAAQLVGSRIAELQSGEPSLPIVVAGDLNEEVVRLDAKEYAYPPALVPWEVWRVWQGESDERPAWYDAVYAETHPFLLVTGDRLPVLSFSARERPVLLYSPWEESGEEGSYWYWNRWERIDHLLCNGAALDGEHLSLRFFTTVRLEEYLSGDRIPLSFEEGGVSDHLPVVAQWELRSP